MNGAFGNLTAQLDRRFGLAVLLLFLPLYGGLFLRYPLTGGLPGNCDTWFAIALANTWRAWAAALIDGGVIGRALYPAPNLFALGESSPLIGWPFALLRAAGLDNLWATWAALSAVFGLTGCGVALLARTYGLRRPAALFAGFAFTCSNFMFANIDDINLAFWFPAALSLAWLRGYLSHGGRSRLLLAAAAGGLTIYGSLYVFVFQALAALVVLVGGREGLQRRPGRELASGAAIFAALPLPFVLFYLRTALAPGLVSQFEVPVLMEAGSLAVWDLARILPDNLIYPYFDGPPYVGGYYEAFWYAVRRHAFLGLLVTGLAGWALLRDPRSERFEPTALAAIGLAMAFGPSIGIAGRAVPTSLLHAVHQAFPDSVLTSFIRMPARAFFLCSLGVSLLAAFALDHLTGRPGLARRRWLAVLLPLAAMVLHATENLPVPLRSFPAREWLDAPPGYVDFFAGQSGRVVADLPSDIEPRGMHLPLHTWNREAIYLLWQTEHRQNTVSGLNGYLPASRRRSADLIAGLPSSASLAGLMEVGVEYLVLHPQLALGREQRLRRELDRSAYLVREFDDGQVAIYRLDRDRLATSANPAPDRQRGQESE